MVLAEFKCDCLAMAGLRVCHMRCCYAQQQQFSTAAFFDFSLMVSVAPPHKSASHIRPTSQHHTNKRLAFENKSQSRYVVGSTGRSLLLLLLLAGKWVGVTKCAAAAAAATLLSGLTQTLNSRLDICILLLLLLYAYICSCHLLLTFFAVARLFYVDYRFVVCMEICVFL